MRVRTACLATLLFVCGREAFAQDVTFNNQVVRIFQQHCQTCHRPGSIAPFSLLTYQDARIHASQIRNAVESRIMPPWKPVDAHGVFEGERTLTDEEITTISQWVTTGAPEGNPSDLPEPISFPETWSAGTPDFVVQPPSSFPLKAGSEDIYRCFTIPVNSASDLYVRGYEVLPGNRSIVHHVLIFTDTSGQSASLDAADPGPGYTCFGGAGFVVGLGGIGGWAPGADPQVFPLGTGVRIPAGARVVMQVHYSTSLASGPLDPDLTRIGLYLSPAPLQAIAFLPVVNTLFTIPPGNPHYQVKAFLPIPTTVELVAIAPHMHLLGREATVVAHFPNGSVKQLIRIEDWDFHWQANYLYREAITLPAGTLIEMTAFYDNSTNNPENPSNPPVPVSWGERTTDEMCLTFISVKAPGIPSMNTVPFSLTDRGTDSVITQGGSATALKVGYARVTDSSGAAPSGLAIFGYRQNGILISEAGVPASRSMTRGRIYGETSPAVRSGVAIANPNSEPAVVSFTFTDENGNDVYSSSATIGANEQVAAFLNEKPFYGPATFSGSFTFTSSKAVAAVALRGVVNERSNFLMTTLPVVDLSSSTSTTAAVFPHFADGGGWTTNIMLVNPTDSLISGTLRFTDPIGSPVSSLNYSIPAKGARQFGTGGSGDEVTVGAAYVVPAQNQVAPAGSLVFSYRKAGIRVTEAGVPTTPPGTAFRVYVEASDAVQSGIAIMNMSSTTASVRVELMNLSGASVSTTSVSLGANGQLARFLTQLPGFQNLSLPVQGLLRITSASQISVVGLRSRTNERGDFLITTTPPVAENSPASAELFFPHFADGGGYTTQFILFSSGNRTSLNGNVRFFSQTGQALDLKLK
jgi:Copper type II ascorbate-dependent monooxygenase, C-terminal domain